MIYASSSGNLQIESTNFTDGRINLVENTLTNTFSQDIQYHHTDHLGSVRAITDNSGSVIEQNAYYPFGSRHTFGNTYAQTTNRFKFNGKEEQTTGNLQYLDYGARMYDNKIGRWLTQDPLSEKYYAYSQYSFSGNNPILNIDNDGKAWDTFIDAAFLIYDLGSALYNHIIGEHKQAQQNWKDVGIDAASMIIPGVAAPMIKGVGKVATETIEVANKLDNAADAGKEGKAIIISIDDSNKIGKDLLNPPLKRGNAPTFKSDNTPVEIHHQGQNSDGPFKEMHKVNHRGKGNYKANHPEHTNKSNINRKQFDKARIEYWKYEYDNWNKRPN